MELDMQSKAASGALVNHEGRPLAVPARQVQAPSITPLDMINSAVQRGASVEQITQLIALKERIEADEARKAFVTAMAQFKKDPPRIEKTRMADVRSKREGAASFAYKFANLADVCGAIVDRLAACGISHDWTTKQQEGLVAVTCTLTHELGHSKSTMLSAGLDLSGGKNNLQALGSTVSYLERYTLLAACGIAVDDEQDNDGADMGLDRNAVRDAVADKRAKEQAGPSEELLAAARAAADAGTKEFAVFWKSAQPAQRGALRNEVRDLEKRCAAADKKVGASVAGRQ